MRLSRSASLLRGVAVELDLVIPYAMLTLLFPAGRLRARRRGSSGRLR